MSLFATSRPRLSKRDMVEGAQRRHPGCTIADARKIDNSTLWYRTPEDGTIYFSLHDTDIITVKELGAVVVDTGGFNTRTTRDRLGYLLHKLDAGSVYTHKGIIYHRWNGVSTPFDRRLVINREKKTVRPDRKVETLDKTTKLIDAYMAEWKKKGLPKGGDGDPWVIFTGISPETMLGWVKDKYVFRTLYAFALQHIGVQDQSIAFYMHDVDRKGGKLDRCDLGRIRRFVRNRLGRA